MPKRRLMTQTKNPHKVNKRSARTPQSLASTLKAENFGSSNEIQYPQRIDLSYSGQTLYLHPQFFSCGCKFTAADD